MCHLMCDLTCHMMCDIKCDVIPVTCMNQERMSEDCSLLSRVVPLSKRVSFGEIRGMVGLTPHTHHTHTTHAPHTPLAHCAVLKHPAPKSAATYT